MIIIKVYDNQNVYDYVDIKYFIGLNFQRNDVDKMVFDYLKCYVDIINSFKTSN